MPPNNYERIIPSSFQDKQKIRHKKRWSQIMYMYYFLGFQLEANDTLDSAQKDARARNTYLLALGAI